MRAFCFPHLENVAHGVLELDICRGGTQPPLFQLLIVLAQLLDSKDNENRSLGRAAVNGSIVTLSEG